jgi:hypothetical protein
MDAAGTTTTHDREGTSGLESSRRGENMTEICFAFVEHI